jgi:hypothetical protein
MVSCLLGHERRTGRLACLMVLVAALLVCVLPQAASAESGLSAGLGTSTELGASAEPGAISSTPSTTQRYTPCPSSADMVAECNLVIDPVPIATTSGYELPDGSPLLGSGERGGLDPENLESAYKIPTTGGSSETVALVDAYGDSTAESDLNKYREKYKVYYKGTETACTKTNGCFKKVNVKGEEANYPAAGPEIWGAETALDIEMVSAACPECHILLVEASGEYPAETAAAVEEAAKLKATEISNSYGYSEDDESACPSKKGCKEYLAAYNQGIPVMASAGDGGYDNENRGYSAPLWPAVSPNVIAVGGTELEKVEKPKEGERGWKEVVWPDSGSGCSLYESEPTWQEAKTVPKACGADRTDNDVASAAEEVSIYTTPYEGGWGNVGGTSASSPFVAGVEAHATSATKKLGADAFYKKPSMLFHISSGSNGFCGAEGSETYYLCHATKEGYNGPTGWGTPDGVFTSAAAPSVTTGSATSVTESGATLNGSVKPNGAETKYYFEYGTTESYGSKTAEASAGSGESNVEESKAVTGLALGTTYDFRITATNSEGTTHGANQKFTPSGKPTVETKAATSVAETGATLNGLVNPKGAETKYYFEYGTTTSYGTKTAEVSAGSGISNVEESKAITGLTAGTIYHFRIVATNTDGTTDGSDREFKTLGPFAETKPATSVGETTATLNGIVNPNGLETKYYFEYGTSESYGSTTAEASAGSGASNVEESKAITGLAAETTYHFRIVASNGAGTTDGKDRTFNTSWSAEEPPSPTGVKQDAVWGMSCVSTTACTSVGFFEKSSGEKGPLAESWNGTAWTVQEPPVPTETSAAILRNVSCPSSTSCVGVGEFDKNYSGIDLPLAESWNGTAWTAQEPPTATGEKQSEVSGVSCVSSTSCIAVGAFENSSGDYVPLAEKWNGTAWTVQEPPFPTGAYNAVLNGVSCTSSTACTAVGDFAKSSKENSRALAETWNGTAWTMQEPPLEHVLHGVSCTSSTACVAVGGTGSAAVAETWNGTTWSEKGMPNPTGAKSGVAHGVSCTSSTVCTALGTVTNASGVLVPLAEKWNGSSWTAQELPLPASANSARESEGWGVSCVSSTMCMGAGSFVNSSENQFALAEFYH